MAWLLRFVLLLIVLRLAWRFVAALIQGALGPGRDRVASSRDAAGVALVKDPVCGTYVLPDRALFLGTGRNAQYFCSDGCRDTYLRQRASRRTA